MAKGNAGFTSNFFASLTGGAVRILAGMQRNPGLASSAPYSVAYDPKVVTTEETALQLASCYAAVRLYVDTIASLPIRAYKILDDGSREELRNHWSLDLLDSPNPFTVTNDDFISQLVYSLILNGNSYAIVKRGGGRVRGITPVMPSQVLTFLSEDSTITHQYTYAGTTETYGADDMIHVKLFGSGIVGLSPLKFHQGTFGIAVNQDKLLSEIYSVGKASGILTIDHALTDAQRNLIKQNFEDIAANPNKRMQVLEADMKFQPISLSPQDMDLLAARRYTVSDICKIFSIPSVLLDNTDGGVYTAGIAPVIDSWFRTGLNPVISRLESALNRALFRGTDEWRNVEIRFDTNQLLRADAKTRADVYSKLFACGGMSVNDIRRAEGYPAVEHGDQIRATVSVLPIDEMRQLGQHNLPTNNEVRTPAEEN